MRRSSVRIRPQAPAGQSEALNALTEVHTSLVTVSRDFAWLAGTTVLFAIAAVGIAGARYANANRRITKMRSKFLIPLTTYGAGLFPPYWPTSKRVEARPDSTRRSRTSDGSCVILSVQRDPDQTHVMIVFVMIVFATLQRGLVDPRRFVHRPNQWAERSARRGPTSSLTRTVLGVLIVAGALFTMSSSPASAAQVGTTKWQQAALLQPPSGQLGLGDIGWFDARHSLYLYADTHDNRLLVVHGQSVKEVSGLQLPAGVVSDPSSDFAWVGDSDSTLKVIDLKTLQITETIPIGGQGKVDELAYDTKDHVLIAANPDDSPPFLTLVSTSPTRHVLAKVPLPTAQKIEQPVWDPATDLFTVNVPEATGAPGGEVVVVSPKKAAIVKTFSLTSCDPSGAVFGSGDNLLIACDSSALVINAKTGAVRATISGGGGATKSRMTPRPANTSRPDWTEASSSSTPQRTR